MTRRPPRSTRTATLFPDPTRFRSKRHVGCDTNTAKIGKYLLRGDFRRLAHRHDGDLDAFSFRCVDQHRQPLDPGGPADCGGMRAAERLDQPVIAAAAKHRALRAQPLGDELERGVAGIIERSEEQQSELQALMRLPYS